MSAETNTSSLQALRQEWQGRWSAMAPRERQLVQVAASLLLLVLVVMLLIRPAWQSVKQTPIKLKEVSAQVARMRTLADEAQALRQQPPVSAAQAEASLKSATEALGPSARLTLQGDRATVEFTKVLGVSLADWLAESRAVARVRPLEANLNQVEPGLYSGTVVVGFAPGPAAAR